MPRSSCAASSSASEAWRRPSGRSTLPREGFRRSGGGRRSARRNHCMASTWTRALVGVVAFFVVLVVGLNVTGTLDATADPNTGLIAAQNTIIAILVVALLVGFAAYAATEYAQTRRLDSITSQFDTRTI